MLAEGEIELRAARLLMYQAAWNADLGKDVKALPLSDDPTADLVEAGAGVGRRSSDL